MNAPASPDELALPERDRIGALIDALATRYGGPHHQLELRLARTEFDQLRGRVFDDDAIYEVHIALFLEWYVIERPLPASARPGHGAGTPVARALEEMIFDTGPARPHVLPSVEHELLVALARSHRSVFEVVAHQKPDQEAPSGLLRLYDLVGSSYWGAASWHPVDGIARGEVVEARLIPWRQRVVLGPTTLFHPSQARPLIHRLIAHWTRGGELAMASHRLAEMRLRHARFRNISIGNIYRERPPDYRADRPSS